jgi:hypothetical protein
MVHLIIQMVVHTDIQTAYRTGHNFYQTAASKAQTMSWHPALPATTAISTNRQSYHGIAANHLCSPTSLWRTLRTDDSTGKSKSFSVGASLLIVHS